MEPICQQQQRKELTCQTLTKPSHTYHLFHKANVVQHGKHSLTQYLNKEKGPGMATKTEIEKAILDATGNPDTGAIRDNLGAMADAVMAVVNPAAAAKADKETRVMKADETR